ncbi:MAG: glycosyl hydrolase family 9 [Verrucomicrobiales bacterium]|nr:glycosyl hydrolase family 9 [Verrucomicrobiales bacterium]
MQKKQIISNLRSILSRTGLLCIFILFGALEFNSAFAVPYIASEISDENPLALPEIGSFGLRVLSPTVLELTLIQTKNPDPSSVDQWNFVGANFELQAPAASAFSVKAGSREVTVKLVGFKRRPLYAPLNYRDLRIAGTLYLTLNTPVNDNDSVVVTNPDRSLWNDAETPFKTVADPLRYNPAIHVNQVGYAPLHPKEAMIGQYLGSLGEMSIPTAGGFNIVDGRSGATVYHGELVQRRDIGYSYEPLPYQQVFEADFTAFQAPGEYRLQVPGLGASYSFLINDGTPAAFARTFALVLYHQRCGGENNFPFTRDLHGACHTNQAEIPTIDFTATQQFLADLTSDYASNPRHSAPQLKNVDASLYPFVNHGKIDVSGGHHDAGDYSKYTINSAGLVHYLIFAADSFPGAGNLDNLGIPESGDGKSDLLQEAKWEADFLAKMQDADGGFYFLVYPKDRQYENDVLPDHGDAQVVWPKTTSVTAAAVAALAEAGSSPLFQAQFPEAAAVYMAKARLGWIFLMNAISKYGKDGAYQKITHYGNEFMHDDELAWAAAAMFAATGDQNYHAKLKQWFPDPNDENTRRWTWWRMFEGYGCAIRSYAFAVRTGRLGPSDLDPIYLAKCENEIKNTADDQLRFSAENAYGASFADPNKDNRTAGWQFASERAFDLTVAYQLTPRSDYLAAIVANWNYEAGCNPVNVAYISGLGWKRQRDIVNQYSQNDRRVLPPSGMLIGNIQAGFAYLPPYKKELGDLCYPPDGATAFPYPFYDRWGDSYNTTCEAVVTDQARSLASVAFWMAQSPIHNQEWAAAAITITGLRAQSPADQPVTASISSPGLDLSDAQIIWEARDQQPITGPTFVFAPKNVGPQWVEVEAQLPDGRRVFASADFVATTSLKTLPNADQSAPLNVEQSMVALYHLDDSLADATGNRNPLALHGNAALDQINLGWLQNRTGGALRFSDLGDNASVSIPSSALKTGAGGSISVEAMIYINELKGHNRRTAQLLALTENWNSRLELAEDTYDGLLIHGGSQFAVNNSVLINALSLQKWHHVVIQITEDDYSVKIDGFTVASSPATEFSNWGSGSGAVLQFGDFDGWIDEVVVRNVGGVVVENQTPSVSIRVAPDAANLLAPASVTLNADANDSDGMISRVVFYQGTTKIGESLTPPYSMSLDGLDIGTYTVSARAYDNNGDSTASTPLTLTVSGIATTAAAPVITPHGGNFDSATAVTIQTATTGAGIHYTTDGSDPVITSPLFSGAINITSNTVLKARSFKAGLFDSSSDLASFVVGSSNALAHATLVQTDITAQGSWKLIYGDEGFVITDDATNLPDYAEVTVGTHQDYEWASGTADIRALQKTGGPDRIAACWLSSTNFTVNCRFSDTLNHEVALYFVDWDRTGRTEQVQVIDAATGLTLDTQTLSDFANGKYLVWNIRGSVRFRFTNQTGPNALLMGLFFAPAKVIPEGTLKPVGVVNGKFQLQLTGSGGSTYAIQSSTDFRIWTTISAVTLTNSTTIVEAPMAPANGSQVFRATPVP